MESTPTQWFSLVMQMVGGEKIYTSYEDGSYICTLVSEFIGTLARYPRFMYMASYWDAPEFAEIAELRKLVSVVFLPTATGPGTMPGDRYYSINRMSVYPYLDTMPAPLPPIVRLVRALNRVTGCTQVAMAEHPQEARTLWRATTRPVYAELAPVAWLVDDDMDAWYYETSQPALAIAKEDVDDEYVDVVNSTSRPRPLHSPDDPPRMVKEKDDAEDDEDDEDDDYEQPSSPRARKRKETHISRKRKSPCKDLPKKAAGELGLPVPFKKRAKHTA